MYDIIENDKTHKVYCRKAKLVKSELMWFCWLT